MCCFLLFTLLFTLSATGQDGSQASEQQMQFVQADQSVADGVPMPASAPRIQQRPVSGSAAIRIRMKDWTRGAMLYYTTDGWTPTTSSTPYTGPFVVDRTATLRAAAFAPGYLRSKVKQVVVTVPGSRPIGAGDVSTVTTLKPGTAVTLQFTSLVDSSRLEVGDTLPLVTAEDILVDGKLLAPRLTPVSASVTQVDKRGFSGQPGTLSFAVHSLTLNDGKVLPLSGGETAEGVERTGASFLGALVPVAGAGSVLIRGGQAVIAQGQRCTVRVAGASQ